MTGVCHGERSGPGEAGSGQAPRRISQPWQGVSGHEGAYADPTVGHP